MAGELVETPKPACEKAYRRLTNEDRVLALQLRERGRTQAQIAQELGCTQQAVSLWLKSATDTTELASLYLKGQALRVARNVVEKGRTRDHVAVLQGLRVLDGNDGARIQFAVGIQLPGMPTFASQPSAVSVDIHSLTDATGSDNS
jgi:hypothetical protein